MKSVLLSIGLMLSVAQVHALIRTGKGNAPVRDPGWPAGAAGVANLPSRFAWWEGPPFGGGEWHFEFAGDTATLQTVLDAFGRLEAPGDLFLQDGAQSSFVLDPNRTNKIVGGVDWTFTVWNTNSWEALYGKGKPIRFSDDPNAGKARPAPRLDVFLAPGSPVAFDQLKIPAHVTVHDERAEAAGLDISGGSVFAAAISDAHTLKPISGAQFIITGRDSYGRYGVPVQTAVSDAQGTARAQRLPSATYQLSAAAEGYVETAITYQEALSPIYKRFAVALARAGTLGGRVTDTNGLAIANMKVIVANTLLSSNTPYRPLQKAEAVSDASGRFSVMGLPVGLAQVLIQSTNYFQTNIFDYHAVPGTNISVVVSRTGALRVRVRDAAGQGVAQWRKRPLQVSVEPLTGAVRGSWGGSATLQPDGTYFFSSVHPGNYLVKLLNTPTENSATVLPDETTEVVMQLP